MIASQPTFNGGEGRWEAPGFNYGKVEAQRHH